MGDQRTPWAGSDRRATLPPDWESRRKRTFRRDGYRCTATNTYGERCPEPAQECDHVGDRLDHSLENLTSLCEWHHGKKTGAQAAQAAHARRKTIENRMRRTEDHPGLL